MNKWNLTSFSHSDLFFFLSLPMIPMTKCQKKKKKKEKKIPTLPVLTLMCTKLMVVLKWCLYPTLMIFHSRLLMPIFQTNAHAYTSSKIKHTDILTLRCSCVLLISVILSAKRVSRAPTYSMLSSLLRSREV